MRKDVAKFGKVVAALSIACLGLTTTAGADSFTFTSGSFEVSRQNAADFSFLVPPVLDARGQLNDFEGETYDPPYFCGGDDCIGRTVNLSMSDSLSRTPNGQGRIVGGLFQFNDTWYEYQTFDYAIVAGDIVTPADRFARTWFRMSGSLTGRSENGAIAAIQFSGSGTASSYWDSRNGWLATSYKLEDPAAVPEPASLFLLSTGLAGIAGLRRRRTTA